MVDINDDGHLDIYVSVSGPEWSKAEQRANLLFVNNGNRTFTEAAGRYGLADTGFTTHSVFLDYDRDGCLDVFVLNNSPQDFFRGVTGHPTGMREQTPDSYNQLYRGDCRRSGTPMFTNVSQNAGILREAGYGLGVAVADLNDDSWPDIFVSNDGTPNDVLYVNNWNGTFTNKAGDWLKHSSVAGMGVDIADFNNDGHPDILQVDMSPRDLERRKRMSGYVTYGSLLDLRRRGFRDDYSVNSLQLSNGITNEGNVLFSEIGRLAGVAHTDWSWSALFADFDNDGSKDIFISNGYPKAVNDLDYQNAVFALGRRSDPASRRSARELLERLPGYAEPNYIFRNAGDLTFADKTRDWGMDQPGFSYGAAYADLDNDGRLDLVVSNIDAPAFIYRNVGPMSDEAHYLEVRLDGETPQRAIGATLVVTTEGRKQYAYYTPYRGFMSTMDARVHFGLGRARRVDSLEVRWPDGRAQLITGLDADRVVTVRQGDARPATEGMRSGDTKHATTSRFQRVEGPRYVHEAGTLVDYTVQPLLPYMISRQGPALAVGDVDGDSLDDVFIGGGAGVVGRLFRQRGDGSFAGSTEAQAWDRDALHEDWGALFFDANGDGRLDLYVASGGYHVAAGARSLQDRLYINQGGGRFARDTAALPEMLTSTATVRAGDFNGDGRADLFVGGRLTPRRYPYPARSYVLRNEGGRFTDVTEQVAPELVSPGGMITDAIWLDFDGDGRLDLVTAGEWMPIQFHRNDGTRLRDVTTAAGRRLRGWWYSLAAGDFDGDGRPDLVAGNFGLNHDYGTSANGSLGVYAHNFTGNQTTDVVLTQRVDGKEYPVAGMAPLGREIYTTAVKFPTYGSFARASMTDLFGAAQLRDALYLEVDTFASMYLHNEGGGAFRASPLPNLAQISPIRGTIPHDVDADGHLDLIVAGNLYDAEPNTPRADAGNGLWLRGDGQGHFAPVSSRESGFLAPLNVSGLALVRARAGHVLLVANTGGSVEAFRIRAP
jgi:hypothetical protein